jgi:hypothetical protein
MSSLQSEYLSQRQSAIDWLIKNNFPPLPVAPAQSAREYPKVVTPASNSANGLHCPLTKDLQPIPLYTGKNPSYLDADGHPQLVVHSDYQKRMPTPHELESWFEHPDTGVGTLGGWNNVIWLDFDQKRFDSNCCDDAVLTIVTAIRDSTGSEPFLERTHSGGWRIGVTVKQKPNFTNFALAPGGQHVGEALGAGRFTVLAPTIGPSGNSYESVHRALVLPIVESLESIGILRACGRLPQEGNRSRSALAFGNAKGERSSADARRLANASLSLSQTSQTTVAKTPLAVEAALRSSCAGSIDLADLICPKSRSILHGADPYSDRSHSLSVAVNELFGWHNWASSNSLSVRGLPIDLAYQAGERLGIDSDRIGRIITSVGDLQSKQPAAFYLGGDVSCWKKIYRLDRNSFERFCPSSIQAAIFSDFNLSHKMPSNQNQEHLDSGQPAHSNGRRSLKLVDRIKSIILTYDNEARATEALMELAASVGKPYSDIAALARLVRSEIESFSELKTAISSVRPLLAHCRKRLDIRRYLVRPLADAILDAAAAMPTAPEYLLNTLIPVAASRIGTSARVVVNPHGGYVQPCIFWTANVANSGQAKTPPQSLIVEPLEDLDQDDRDRYAQELADWQAATDKNKGPKPIETRRILNDTTTAQKIRIHNENPRGLIEYLDELTADYERLNQFNGGKGADLRHELGLFNGKFGAYDRGDVRLYLRRVAFSKTGTYQWDTLSALMSDQVDFIASGYLARFLLCSIVDAPERKLDLFSDRDSNVLSQMLRTLYRRLETQPERDYLLSHEAKLLFQAFNHSLVAAEIQESHFGLALVYAKIESYAARLALWLHIVNAVVQGEEPAPVISGETMRAAIELACFYLWQHKLIYAHNAPSTKLDGVLLRVQTCALKLWSKGKALTASFAKSRVNPIKSWSTSKIRDKIFRVLALAGLGRTEGHGDKTVYIPSDSSSPPSPPSPHSDTFTVADIGGFGDQLAVEPIAESIVQQEDGSIVDTVGEHVIPPAPEVEGIEDCHLDLSTNITNNSTQSPVVSELEEVDNPPTSSPTVGELQAILIGCTAFTQAMSLRSSHQELFKQAYQSLSQQQQEHFDSWVSSRYAEPIYKYVGIERHDEEGYSLITGDLVRLKNLKTKPILTHVLPLHAPVALSNFQSPQFVGVNPNQLKLVEKLPPPSAGVQMNLL